MGHLWWTNLRTGTKVLRPTELHQVVFFTGTVVTLKRERINSILQEFDGQ